MSRSQEATLSEVLQPTIKDEFSFITKLKAYYRLTKPGIIYGNALTALAGFLLASGKHVDFQLLAATLFGTSLVIAAACVCNNYLDRGIDAKMERTRNRALVTGTISTKQALLFGTALAISGFGLLVFTNAVTVVVGIIALIDYVILYGIGKRTSVHGTIIGSISGSMPILAGYTAVTGHIDAAALILFMMLTFWQMPHFYAIAIYRLKDYKAAGLPVLPAVRGLQAVKRQMLVYTVLFWMASLCLTIFDYTGYVYGAVMTIVAASWFWITAKGWKITETKANITWARQVFGRSLIVIMVLAVSVSLGGILP